MAAPVVVNASSVTTSSGVTMTVNAPASLVVGNLLIAVIAPTTGSSALVAPPGWLPLLAGGGAQGTFFRYVDGTEPSSWTWTWTTASLSDAIIIQISGTARGLGIDAVGYQANGSSTNITAPAITPRWNACLLLSVYLDTGANTITVPASQTGNSLGSAVGNTRSVIAAWENLSSAASTGTRVATASGAAANYGFNFAIAEPSTLGGLLLPAGFDSIPDIPVFRGGAVSGRGPGVGIGFAVQFAMRAPFAGFYAAPFIAAGEARLHGWSGSASISGTCKVNGTPVAGMWVYLSPMNAQGLVIGAFYTSDDGTFVFEGLAPGAYVVDGVDPSGVHNGVLYEEIIAY